MIENYNLDQIQANNICLEQSNEKKTLDFIKRELIKLDCFLLRNTRSKLGYSLIITDWFVNSENVAFLRWVIFNFALNDDCRICCKISNNLECWLWIRVDIAKRYIWKRSIK